jgi:hypothetical protein
LTEREFQFAARTLVASETYKEAHGKAREHLVDRLLKAKTPEEREEKWRDIDALERVWTLLAIEGQKANN